MRLRMDVGFHSTLNIHHSTFSISPLTSPTPLPTPTPDKRPPAICYNRRRMPPVLLTCERLTKSYTSRPPFNNLSFSLFEGDHVGLVGPNGSGKRPPPKTIAGEG